MWKNRAKIMECFESKSLKIKKNRNPTHQDIENALLVLFKAQKSQNVPISGPLLQEKANHFAKQHVCSESWIYRFAINILDAIEMTTAWARVTPGTIKKCFSHAGFGNFSNLNTIDDNSDDELDNLPLARLSSAEANVTDWETYVNIDDQVITTDNLTDNEIIESMLYNIRKGG
ncbi:unnamed protein product [Parnassius apollo]|uniref:(apollo) hypothetical protein n=1 Tax=Parnassius apollo TaxID=110799 RepID=A0A8S3W4G2_PARAO|nr:unnamed protein product [Parnassius apollo]